MSATLQWIVIPKPAPGTNTTPVTLAISAATTIVDVIDNKDGTVTVYFV
jgi:hypothetical protein